MKKQLLILSFLGCGFAFGQNLTFSPVLTAPLVTNEVFRFSPGFMGQVQAGSPYTFGALDKWFSLGQVNATVQNFYGLRFQNEKKHLLLVTLQIRRIIQGLSGYMTGTQQLVIFNFVWQVALQVQIAYK